MDTHHFTQMIHELDLSLDATATTFLRTVAEEAELILDDATWSYEDGLDWDTKCDLGRLAHSHAAIEDADLWQLFVGMQGWTWVSASDLLRASITRANQVARLAISNAIEAMTEYMKDAVEERRYALAASGYENEPV